MMEHATPSEHPSGKSLSSTVTTERSSGGFVPYSQRSGASPTAGRAPSEELADKSTPQSRFALSSFRALF